MRSGGCNNTSLKLSRHVLRWMGRFRMTSMYGSSAALLDSNSLLLASARCHQRCWSSSDYFHKHHHQRSTLILTSQTKDGNGSDGGGGGGKDSGDRKTVTTTTTSTPGTTPSATPSSRSDHLRDVPRRIHVKKSGSTAAEMNAPGKGADSNSNNTKHLKQQQQHVGYLKRRFPLHNEIADTNNKTIWTPAKPIVVESQRTIKDEPSLPDTTNSGNNSNNNNIIKQQLAQIRAGAWLDPSIYCKGGGTTIAGTEAARKLLRGKKDLIELLGYAVHSHAKQSIVLQCHGIPRQVLQHHIDYAARLLCRLQAQEVSFKQFNEIAKYNSVAAMDAVQSLRRVLVRSAVTGESHALPWPLVDEEEPVDETQTESDEHSPQQPQQQPWVDDLTLYWTVMNRIATRLGVAVLLKRPGLGRERLELMATASSEPPLPQPQHSSHSMLRTPPYYWKVEFQRELHFSPEQLPPTGLRSSNSALRDNNNNNNNQLPEESSSSSSPPQHLFPVLEFTPLQGVAAPGHCRIRLQGTGYPANGEPPMNVSLSFDACFRIHHFATAS